MGVERMTWLGDRKINPHIRRPSRVLPGRCGRSTTRRLWWMRRTRSASWLIDARPLGLLAHDAGSGATRAHRMPRTGCRAPGAAHRVPRTGCMNGSAGEREGGVGVGVVLTSRPTAGWCP